jgi:hypothetical protein
VTTSQADKMIEDLLRTLAPQALGAVVRRYGNFELAEDAVKKPLSLRPESGRTRGSPRTRGHGSSPSPPAGSPTSFEAGRPASVARRRSPGGRCRTNG